MNDNIREAIQKFMEEESISDANNITADTFSHTLNTQRYNTHTLFTSEKIHKSDKLADALDDLTINDAKYFESSSATASDAQGDPIHSPETFTHTRNRKEKVTDTSNRKIE